MQRGYCDGSFAYLILVMIVLLGINSTLNCLSDDKGGWALTTIAATILALVFFVFVL